MNASFRLGHGSPVSFAIVLSLLLALTGASLPVPQAAARQQTAPSSLELPAMSLSPADLAEAGMPGYGLLDGQTVGTSALAGVAGDWTDQITNDDIEATLVDMGLIEGYEWGMRLRQYPADFRSDLARDVYGSLHEFDSEAGASDALLMAALLNTADPEIQRIEGTGAAGPNAVLARTTFGEGADQTHSLTIAFQSGPVIGVLKIVDYLGQEPAVGEIESLATLQMERIQSAIQSGTLGLGNKVLRLKDPEFNSLYEIRRDEYLRRDGSDIPQSFETPEQLAQRAVRAGDATDYYELIEFIQEDAPMDPAMPYQFGWSSRIYRFHDDTAAAAWMNARPDQIEAEYVGTDEAALDLQIVRGAPAFGDESISVAYTESNGFSSEVHRVFLRVANTVADIRLSSLDELPPTAIDALAALEAQCLVNTCPEPVLITDALAGRAIIGGQGEEVGTPALADEGTQGPVGQDALDLAAMTLMPADLDALGVKGFGSDYGQMSFPDTKIADTAAYRGLAEAGVRAVLEGAGFVRQYEHFLYQPSETDPSGPVERAIVSYIVEFSTAEGATDGWAFLEDESASSTSEDVPMTGTIGDQSEATHDANQDPAIGNVFDMVDLTFQHGNLHAGVTIVDWTGQAVDIAQAEALARKMQERIGTVIAQGAPRLSNQVVRLTGGDTVLVRDEYFLMNGNAVRVSGESSISAAGATFAAALEGQIDGYRVWHQLTAGTEDTADDGWYILSVTRFANAEVASSWLAGSQARVESNTAYVDPVFSAGPAAGEESLGYSLTSADGTLRYQGVVFRVGTIVVSLEVATPEGPPLAAMEALVQAQAACLETGICLEPLAVPLGL